MTKVVVNVLAAFIENASENTFIQIFGGEDIAAHIYHKFLYECNRDVLILVPFLTIENEALLYHYLDKLVSAEIVANVKRKVVDKAAYERGEKERLAVLGTLDGEAKRSLELQRAFDALPEKSRQAVKRM